eukprot:6850796-Heterocapsa_arctica.AAC.1
MASDFVPNLLNIMDVTEMAEKGGVVKEKTPEMEKMDWDMELVVMHEELNSSRTCVPEATIVPELLCHDTKGCI